MFYHGLIEIYKNKKWILITTIIFFSSLVISSLIAAIMPSLARDIFTQFFAEIEKIGEEVFGGHPLMGIWQLFLNNLRASLVFLLGGFILAIPTIIGLISNGGAIGALAVLSTAEGTNPFIFIMAVLPHGIIEIPAILLSGSFGLKMGLELIKPANNLSRFNNLKVNIKLIIKIIPIIIILLFLAAIIEVLITPVILNLFIDTGQL